MTAVFLHGLESSSKGTKGTYFRERFPDMIIPDFTGELAERMATLNTVLAGKSDLVLVGSSFGGLMATLFAMEHALLVKKLILLAPAFNFMDWSQYPGRAIKTPARVYIGTHDTVTPISAVEPVARKFLKNISFHQVDDDHLLGNTFFTLPWSELLT